MGGVGGAAPDAKNEQPASAFANLGQFIDGAFNGGGIELGGERLDFAEVMLGKAHNHCRDGSNTDCRRMKREKFPVIAPRSAGPGWRGERIRAPPGRTG